MTLPLTSRLREIVDRILEIPGRLGPEAVGAACSIVLHEVACANPQVREYRGQSNGEPFTSVTFRGPATPSNRQGTVVLEIRSDARLTRALLRDCFELRLEHVEIDSHVPPDGVVSFREQHPGRALMLDFDIESGMFRMVSVHESTEFPHR